MIAKDLARHYRDRIGTLTVDCMDTMRIAEVPTKDGLAAVIGNLLMHAIVLTAATGTNKRQFLQACATAWDKMQEYRKP